MKSGKEYSATTTKARGCYSNIPSYGVDGRISQIIPPQPSSLVPQLFNVAKPNRQPKYTQSALKDVWYSRNCQPYSTLNGTCK